MNEQDFKCSACKNTKCKIITVDLVGECMECEQCHRIRTNRKCHKCGHTLAGVGISELGGFSVRCSKCGEPLLVKEDDPQLVEAYEREQEQLRREQERLRNNPKCPQCGSTAITAATRGYTLLQGIWGSNDPVNYCTNCGYKWEPR